MGKGQTRLWKFLFTASCQAVWSRSQELLKWSEPRSHHLILFFWMLAALQWHWRERHKHTVSSSSVRGLTLLLKCVCTLWESPFFYCGKTAEICSNIKLAVSKYHNIILAIRVTLLVILVVKPEKLTSISSISKSLTMRRCSAAQPNFSQEGNSKWSQWPTDQAG